MQAEGVLLHNLKGVLLGLEAWNEGDVLLYLHAHEGFVRAGEMMPVGTSPVIIVRGEEKNANPGWAVMKQLLPQDATFFLGQ